MPPTSNGLPITLQDIKDAHARIKPYVMRTPLIPSRTLSEKCGAQVLLKLENLQPTGSFKLRGATNRLLQLTTEEKARGVITVSSGNHGKAVAHIGQSIGHTGHHLPFNAHASLQSGKPAQDTRLGDRNGEQLRRGGSRRGSP